MLLKIKKFLKSWPLPAFASAGDNVCIARPRFVHNPRWSRIGSGVYIGKDSILSALGSPADHGRIEIGDRVWATSRLSIFARQEVIIEDDVLIASNVFISDSSYGHATAEIPYARQPMGRIAPVRIGAGSWLGQNVVILPGVTIGAGCIVGANSVVTRSLPPGSVAVGAPAKIVKSWDFDSKEWKRIETE